MTAAASAAPTLAVARDVLGTKPRARRGMTMPRSAVRVSKRVVVFDRWFQVQRRNRRAALADEVHRMEIVFAFFGFSRRCGTQPPTRTQPM